MTRAVSSVPLLALLVAAASGCGGSAASSKNTIYEVSVTVTRVPPEYEGLRSHLEATRHTEWVDPAGGRFREEIVAPIEPGRDELAEDVIVFTGSRCGRYGSSHPVPSVFIGSRARTCLDKSIALRALARYVEEERAPPERFRVERNGFEYEVVVEEAITEAEAEKRGLFMVATAGGDVERGLDPGEPPTLPVKAYWFAARLGEREAVAAIEHRQGGDVQYSVFYPDEATKSHAYPGLKGYPDDEVQVGSQPVDGRLAQKTLDAFEALPRVTIALETGERATLFPNTDTEGNPAHVVTSFAVVTETTLVSVSGRFRDRDVRRLAGRLRPL